MTKITNVSAHPRKGTKGVSSHNRELQDKKVPHISSDFTTEEKNALKIWLLYRESVKKQNDNLRKIARIQAESGRYPRELIISKEKLYKPIYDEQERIIREDINSLYKRKPKKIKISRYDNYYMAYAYSGSGHTTYMIPYHYSDHRLKTILKQGRGFNAPSWDVKGNPMSNAKLVKRYPNENKLVQIIQKQRRLNR